jgi:hypothetical protein
MMLGGEDLSTLIEEQTEITVDCEFCGNRYSYNRESATHVLYKLTEQTPADINSDQNPPSEPKTLH